MVKMKAARSRSFRYCVSKGHPPISGFFQVGDIYIYIFFFVTAYDSKTHLTLSSMMGELSWRMSGIACWLAIHALAGRIKFVLIFNLKDCPKTMRKWYGNMFEVETSSKVVTCFSIIRVNQFLHPYVAFAVSIIRAFAYHFSIWNLFCFQKSKVQRWITRHLRFLLLMSGHPLVSDANYNPRGQARRHFVTWDDNEPSGGWWLMVVLGICFTCFFKGVWLMDGSGEPVVYFQDKAFQSDGAGNCPWPASTHLDFEMYIFFLMFLICCWNIFSDTLPLLDFRLSNIIA